MRLSDSRCNNSSAEAGVLIAIADNGPSLYSTHQGSPTEVSNNFIPNSTILVPPRKMEKNRKMYLLRLSRQPVSRDDVIELSKTFEDYLRERQVKMSGYCPIRRELYDLLFNELIRQATIDCAERGSLLLRVRDEFHLTMDAYQKLYESGVEYGSRKALEAEIEQQKVEIQCKQLQAEVQRVEQRSKEMRAQIEAEEKLRQQSIDMKQAKHEERMEFLKRLNRQLKVNFVSFSSFEIVYAQNACKVVGGWVGMVG
ncbi:Axonemal dynein light intermediate polypeptide 1 [Araneus ventricosus]|uniref:Axonemal dynein light intermediate polypeptide 1 n=1 Tax=Araneus ventricosus TaxID=182803 RepID=A0A4Y2ICL0_ARAVE|nr:Axonemal dynein light intermediate polypeptide 1 [Araneus ventricosus]